MCVNRRVFGVQREGNVDPAIDVHGELTSQNVLFKAETVRAASEALGVRGVLRVRGRGGGWGAYSFVFASAT